MRRIIHQRNSFNNYHIMIGGMEDEERERRQREWDAWRAEEREIWDRQQRKATHMRERDDVNRGYWELTEPLTTDEEYELHNLNDFDKWEEVTGDKKRMDTNRPRRPTEVRRAVQERPSIQRQRQFCRNPSTSERVLRT